MSNTQKQTNTHTHIHTPHTHTHTHKQTHTHTHKHVKQTLKLNSVLIIQQINIIINYWKLLAIIVNKSLNTTLILCKKAYNII